MNKEEYAIFPGQIKINNCTYFGLDYELTDFVNHLAEQNQKYKEVIDKSREYLTSYSSIHTIQFGTENDSLNDIELNKTLDEKTLNEMTNRYLKVHDKLLDILKEVE